MLLNFVVFVVLYNCMLAKCMYVFYISLARKNGHGQLPEHNLSINQSILGVQFVIQHYKEFIWSHQVLAHT